MVIVLPLVMSGMKPYRYHSSILFPFLCFLQSCILSCPMYPVVVGLSWLALHNPFVNWKAQLMVPRSPDVLPVLSVIVGTQTTPPDHSRTPISCVNSVNEPTQDSQT